jgi:hypothetical protein
MTMTGNTALPNRCVKGMRYSIFLVIYKIEKLEIIKLAIVRAAKVSIKHAKRVEHTINNSNISSSIKEGLYMP